MPMDRGIQVLDLGVWLDVKEHVQLFTLKVIKRTLCGYN